jgi:pilus assembly protein CpaF
MSMIAHTQDPFATSLRFFLGPVATLLDDPSVTEIMVNGPDDIYVERGSGIERTTLGFESEDDLLAATRNIAQYIGRSIGPQDPILDGRLPDGSRVCIVLAPLAATGTTLCIRKFLPEAVSASFLLDRGSLTAEMLDFLQGAVKAHRNVIVRGGKRSGKTTLLNILAGSFGDAERIVVIEDTRELQIPNPHQVQLEARQSDAHGRGAISVRDLFVTSLRLRPDRIIIGEVRRGEALDLIQALTSGHRGALATLHANTPRDACHRLETMALMADTGMPLQALRQQIVSAVDLVVQTSRMPSGQRFVTHISEVEMDETGSQYEIRDLFAVCPDERSD